MVGQSGCNVEMLLWKFSECEEEQDGVKISGLLKANIGLILQVTEDVGIQTIKIINNL